MTLPLLLGVKGTAVLFPLVGVCARLTAWPVGVLLLLCLTGVLNDLDLCMLWGVCDLVTICSEHVPLQRRPGVWPGTFFDFRTSVGVGGAFLL